MKPRHRSRAGLSLAEVMIAMSLFTLGMLGFFALTSQLRNVRQLSDDLGNATLLAGSTMEGLRAGGAGAIANGSNTLARFTVNWTVSTVNPSTARFVTVQVRWNDLRAKPHLVTLRSVVAP